MIAHLRFLLSIERFVAGGKAELTGEAIVIRHADEFEESVVTAAKDKLIKNGVEVSDILSKTER